MVPDRHTVKFKLFWYRRVRLVSAFDTCTADVATATQTAGSRDLRSIMLAVRSNQINAGAARASLAARKPSPRRHVPLLNYIYFTHVPYALQRERHVAKRTHHEAYQAGRYRGSRRMDGSASQIVQRASMQLAALASLACALILLSPTEANGRAGEVPGKWPGPTPFDDIFGHADALCLSSLLLAWTGAWAGTRSITSIVASSRTEARV